MTAANAFPVAVQEKQTTPEAPDFTSHIERLEQMAAAGVETPSGVELFQFRAGIEVEFGLIKPEDFRKEILEDSSESLSEIALEMQARGREREVSKVRNPQLIDGSSPDTTELIGEFREYAAGFIKRLPAANAHEEAKRAEWLSQLPNFGIREVINFLIYEEFSHPTLSDNSPNGGGELAEIDGYTDRQGWLEFKFGTGSLQTGYYDNENVCEVRVAPCAPSEAVRRKQIIVDRIAEIGSQFGRLVYTASDMEHINLSAYKADGKGKYLPVIGQDDNHRSETLNVMAGVAAAFQDGLWLHPDNMKWDYVFSKHGGQDLSVSPSRTSLRIMDGRFELRTLFHQTDQAVNWLMAGAIDGLHRGQNAIEAEGYGVPQEATIFQVHRLDGFNKATDLHIQRAFERSQQSGRGFELDEGFNVVRGEEITYSLMSDMDDIHGCDIFNSFVFSSIDVGDDGVPRIDPKRMQEVYASLNERQQPLLAKFGVGDIPGLAQKLNERLKVISLQPTMAILGKAHYGVADRPAALDRLAHSSVTELALGEDASAYIAWLDSQQVRI